MPDQAEPVVCRFDDFLLDTQAGALWRLQGDGRRTLIQLGSRAFQILCLLVDRHGEIVSQREIMDAVWSNVAVEPNNLTVQLSALRRVLDADRGQGSCIRNIPGRGYRFMPTVSKISNGSLEHAARAQPRDHEASVPPLPLAGPERPRIGHKHLAWVTALGVFVAVVGMAWYIHRTPPAPAEAAAGPARSISAERPRFSLVVLPFSNPGGDDVGDATADAITQDVTAEIARQNWLMVTASNSAFAYKAKPIDVRRVGEELGVRYAVEGSVRRSDGSLRVNVQLVSTESGAHIWADRFDVGRDGVGYGLDNIVRQIGFVLQTRLAEIESARGARERPGRQDLTDVLTRARAVYNLPPSEEKQTRLLALYERAVELDPTSAEALAGLAEALLESVPYWSTDDPTAPAKFRRAEQLIVQAEHLRPDQWRVALARLILLRRQFRCAELIPFAQRASEAHPLLSTPYFSQGLCLLFAGRPSEAVARFKQAIDVHPRNPAQNSRYSAVGYGLLFQGEFEEAIPWFHKALAANPGADAQTRGSYHAAIAAAHALAGDTAAARLSAAEANRLWPPLTARGYLQFDARESPVYLEQLSRLRNGLRLAGIRDHADEDADPGLPSDEALRADYQAVTPIAVPGARTIRTPELAALLEQRKPLVLDTHPLGRSLPAAIALWGAGIGGSTSDEYQERLGRKMQQLTGGDRGMPVVTIGWNAERYQGRNLALRLVALGYTEVYWYRGGREAWQAAALPDAEVIAQDW